MYNTGTTIKVKKEKGFSALQLGWSQGDGKQLGSIAIQTDGFPGETDQQGIIYILFGSAALTYQRRMVKSHIGTNLYQNILI
jgi:hypothetical protein